MTYEGIREEHSAVRTHAGMFDVSHMGEVEVEGPGALAFLQRVLSNDVARARGRRRPVLLPLQRGRRRPRRPLHLPARRRPLPDRHQRRQPRGRPRLARALEPRLRRRRPRRRRPLRDARRAGPARPRRSLSRALGIELPPRMRVAPVADRRPPGAGLRHRLHRRGRGRAADRPRGRAADLGRAARRRRRPLRARRPRHAAARGLLPPARQRPDARAQPDRGRARLVLRGGDRLPRLRGGRRARAPRAPPRSWPRS